MFWKQQMRRSFAVRAQDAITLVLRWRSNFNDDVETSINSVDELGNNSWRIVSQLQWSDTTFQNS